MGFPNRCAVWGAEQNAAKAAIETLKGGVNAGPTDYPMSAQDRGSPRSCFVHFEGQNDLQ